MTSKTRKTIAAIATALAIGTSAAACSTSSTSHPATTPAPVHHAAPPTPTPTVNPDAALCQEVINGPTGTDVEIRDQLQDWSHWAHGQLGVTLALAAVAAATVVVADDMGTDSSDAVQGLTQALTDAQTLCTEQELDQ